MSWRPSEQSALRRRKCSVMSNANRTAWRWPEARLLVLATQWSWVMVTLVNPALMEWWEQKPSQCIARGHDERDGTVITTHLTKIFVIKGDQRNEMAAKEASGIGWRLSVLTQEVLLCLYMGVNDLDRRDCCDVGEKGNNC